MAGRRDGTLDVTEGVIWKQLLTLCIPVFVASFFQEAYSFVDAWVVGQWAGKEALGGIQANAALIDLSVGFAIGVSSGCAIICGQRLGARDDRGLSTSIHTAMGISVLGGALFCFVGLFGVKPLLILIDTPADLMSEATSYGWTYFSGMLFSIMFNMGSAVLRAVGDTRTPSIIVALTGVINIALDFVFVALFGMGAAGAGLATALSMAAGAILTVRHLALLSGPCHLDLRHIAIDKETGSIMMRTGLPLGFQSAAYSVSNIVFQATINSFGSDVAVAWGISGRADSIIWMSAEALGMAVTTFSAQNYGAKNMVRIRRGLWASFGIALVVIGSASTVVALATKTISLFFISDATLAAIAAQINLFVAPFYIFFAVMYNISGTIRGTGESFWPMVFTLVGTCFVRIGWLVAFVPTHHTLIAALLAFPISWIATLLIFIAYYRSGRWQNRLALD